MANVNAPMGFKPRYRLGGGDITPHEYIVATGQIIYKGDLVDARTDGTVIAAAADDGASVLGVAAEYVDDSASAGGKIIMIYDQTDIVYEVQVDGGTLAATDVFATADHVATTGDTTTHVSKHELNATVGGLQCRILGLVPDPDNAWGADCNVYVVINEGLFYPATASVT